MKKRPVSLVIVLSLLIYAVAGSSGCGKTNSLWKIAVTPAIPVFAKGTMYQLTATALFSDGLTVPSWIVVTWRSSDPTVATVSSTGLVSGIKTGTAVITATDTGHPGISDSVTVYVTDLLSITVDPAIASVSTASFQQFMATGIYTADTPSAWSATWPPNITTMVLWESSSTLVAEIRNVLGLHGLATAVSAGTTTITARDLATSITGTAILTVVP